MTDTTLVLVHGAFAESSSWGGVISLLHRLGVGGPVLLVGHSYGGMVITEAGARSDAVTGLVYVAAFAPDRGENALGLTNRYPGSTLGQTVRPYPLGDGTHDLVVDRDLFGHQFAGDVPLAEATIAAATQRPIRDSALSESVAVAEPAWRTLPSWFVFGSGDRNIPVEGLRSMAERAGSLATREIPGASHSVMVSHPEAVADLVGDALAHLTRQGSVRA